VNRIPIIDEGKVTGVVSSFRRKDEMEEVSRQLTRIQHYAETLRSQAHEYSNKLHTIAGLIEIGATEQALEIIGQETQDHQALLHFLVDAVKDPVLSGCLLGKFNRAHEMGLKLTIDPESRIDVLPPHIAAEQLVTVLGNILDNAFEATLKNHGKEIQLSMTDLGNDLIFEVEDQGAGIPPAEVNQIFEKGVSSKAEAGHGWGLYLASQIVNQLHGQIEVECPSKGGSRITVYLPKRQHS
jgi:two-component system CitB family sensor kinase